MPRKKQPKRNNDSFKCQICHGIFYKGWTDEEALEEAARDFPTVPIEETGLICDDCYKLITEDIKANPWKYPPLPERKK
jgi:nitrate/TMAO reductase-like tetraheme cytochrome c subunit